MEAETKEKEAKKLILSSNLRRLGTEELLNSNFMNEDALPTSAREALEEKFQVSWDIFYKVFLLDFT